MRNGRSHRKSRSSRPALSAHVLSSAGLEGRGEGPQIVVGIAHAREDIAPTPDAVASEVPRAAAAPPPDAVASEVPRAAAASAPPPDAVASEVPRGDTASAPSGNAVASTQANSAAPPTLRLPDVPPEPLDESTEGGSTERVSARAQAAPTAEAAALEIAPTPDTRASERLRAADEGATRERPSIRLEAGGVSPPSSARADELSIPPIGDLSVEPVAERFFSDGDLTESHGGLDDDMSDEEAAKARRKRLPHVVERRARLSRYVGWTVGVSAVVCIAALARTALQPHVSSASSVARASSANVERTASATGAPIEKAASPEIAGNDSARLAAAAQAPAPLDPTPAPSKASDPTQVIDEADIPLPEPAKVSAEPAAAPGMAAAAPPAIATATTATPAIATAAIATAATTEAATGAVPIAAAAAAAAPEGEKTALQEKNDARRALERGKLADSIAAGERAVALDPTDGEAWLLLGAAYQEKGNMSEARRCYGACVKQGKRGPLGECRAMLR